MNTYKWLWIILCSVSPSLAEYGAANECDAEDVRIEVRRLDGNPIVPPNLGPRMGSNVQGPSLIRVPDWIQNRLGKYYLYFADHKGSYIRLAYADRLEGPWQMHEGGSLSLEHSRFLTERAAIPEEFPDDRLGGYAKGAVEGVPDPMDSATKPHVASPDVHVREDLREIIMYFHGLEAFRFQRTRVARSKDGIHFETLPDLVANSYLRAFRHDGRWYGIAMPGVFYRSPDGLVDFEEGPTLFPNTMRHAAVLKRGDALYVFWTRVGDAPEHILLSTIDISGNWTEWKAKGPVDVLSPEEDWEGADLPVEPSVRDAINVRVHQLRDPAIYEEDGSVYLLYALAGEAGIGIAEITLDCTR